VQAVAYGSGGVLDLDTFLSVVRHKVAEHRNKALMNDAGDARPPSALKKPARSWITDAQAGLDHEDSPSRAEVVSVFLDDDEESLYGDESVMGFESPEARLKSPPGSDPRFRSPRARRVRSPEASPGGPPNSNNPLTPPPPKGDSPGPMRDARHTPVASLSSPFEAAIAKRRGEVELAVEEDKSV
jgi:hypothetical protein